MVSVIKQLMQHFLQKCLFYINVSCSFGLTSNYYVTPTLQNAINTEEVLWKMCVIYIKEFIFCTQKTTS